MKRAQASRADKVFFQVTVRASGWGVCIVRGIQYSIKRPGSQGLQRLQRRPCLAVNLQDNGMGMAHKDIPDMLGRVLSGTKYGVKQTRGKFGLGAKMALIWSKMSTGLPIEVTSARPGSATRSYFKLDLDIQRWVVMCQIGCGFGVAESGEWQRLHGPSCIQYLNRARRHLHMQKSAQCARAEAAGQLRWVARCRTERHHRRQLAVLPCQGAQVPAADCCHHALCTGGFCSFLQQSLLGTSHCRANCMP